MNLAIDILAALYDSERSGTCSTIDCLAFIPLTRVTDEEQKTLCQLLNQLQIEPGMNLRDMQKINILLSYHDEVGSPFMSVHDSILNSIHYSNLPLTIFQSKRYLIGSRTDFQKFSQKS